jgi:hypothetical protein
MPASDGTQPDEQVAEHQAQAALGAAGFAVGSHRAVQQKAPIAMPAANRPSGITRTLGGPAHPLDPSLRARLEKGFVTDLGSVRIHDDGHSAISARALRADAFAVGQHIVFGHGQFAPSTSAGIRLLAHEVAHIVQQTGVAGGGLALRDATPKEKVWLPELEEILPRGVGPLAAIDRVGMLLDLFGDKRLEQHVLAINSDPKAKAFTQANGVPAVVALFDTSKDGRLDVDAAQRALKENASLYTRDVLENATRQESAEAPRSFFFESAEKQKLAGPGPGEMPLPGSEERQVVFVEPGLSAAGTVFVRFAYPKPEIGSERVRKAKLQILDAISIVQRDLSALPPAASAAERREQSSVRARLSEPWLSFTRSRPLQVYIATDPRVEFATSQVAAFTDRVFVRLEDVGHEDRLQAAIRIPLILLRGGVMPTPGGVVDVQPIGAGLPATVLHESLHVMLIQRSADAEAIWRANQKKLTVHANPYLSSRFTELVRKFLIAQEEVFAYENEATLYPPVSKFKADYDGFVKNARMFLERRRLKLTTVTRAISVRTPVDSKAVSWSIDYSVPEGEIDLGVAEQEEIGLVLATYLTP